MTEPTLKCPECDSEVITTEEYDFGMDLETGYRNAGTHAWCLACGHHAEIQDFEVQVL